MKAEGTMASLLQGVSQQPYKLRKPGQHTSQKNMWSDPADGLTRRPASRRVAGLGSLTGYTFADITVGDVRYIAALSDSSVKVIRADTGELQTVATPSAPDLAYLGGTLVAGAYDNGLYIANTDITVAMLSTTPTYSTGASFITLLGGQYGRAYTVNVLHGSTYSSTITVSHTTPDGAASVDINDISTTNIAAGLRTALLANTTIAANFDVLLSGDILYMRLKSGATITQFKLTVDDGDGGANIKAINNSAKDPTVLPKTAVQNYVVTITGDSSADVDNYYLKWTHDVPSTGTGAGFGGTGVWVECSKPGEPYLLDSTTMPRVLTRDAATGVWTLSAPAWAGRQVGDAYTNENPSFVGKKITDIVYFQGRLGFLAGQNIIMSRTNQPLDFWIETAVTQTDSDAIDISSTANNNALMRWAVPHNRDLVIFGDRGQFIVFGRNQLTPRNASLVYTAGYDADLSAKPVASGAQVYFGGIYGQYTALRELTVNGASDVNEAILVSAHVPKYIPLPLRALYSATNLSAVFIAPGAPNKHKLYVYQYLWVSPTERAQSAFHVWEFPTDILHVSVADSSMYILFANGNLDVIDFDNPADAGVPYSVRADHKILVSGVTTSVAVPYSGMTVDTVRVVQGEGCPNPGLPAPVLSVVGNTVSLSASMGGGTVIVGYATEFEFTPTKPSVKDANSGVISGYNLFIKEYTLLTKDTGSFKATLSSKYRPPVTITYSGRYISDPDYLVGEAPLAEEAFTVPVLDYVDNIDMSISGSTAYPMSAQYLQWGGRYVGKGGQHITSR